MIQLWSDLDVLKKRPQNKEFMKIRWHNCNLFQVKLILAKKKKKSYLTKIIQWHIGTEQKNETDGLAPSK